MSKSSLQRAPPERRKGLPALLGRHTITAADATEFTLRAAKVETLYTIGEHQCLAKNASSLSYQVTIVVGEDHRSYDEATILQMSEIPDPFAHTDRNTLAPDRLRRTAQPLPRTPLTLGLSYPAER